MSNDIARNSFVKKKEEKEKNIYILANPPLNNCKKNATHIIPLSKLNGGNTMDTKASTKKPQHPERISISPILIGSIDFLPSCICVI